MKTKVVDESASPCRIDFGRRSGETDDVRNAMLRSMRGQMVMPPRWLKKTGGRTGLPSHLVGLLKRDHPLTNDTRED